MTIFCEKDNYQNCIYLTDISLKIKEMISPNLNGSYTIYININLNPAARIRAYNHALKHIKNNDFYNGKDINEIERSAHYE